MTRGMGPNSQHFSPKLYTSLLFRATKRYTDPIDATCFRGVLIPISGHFDSVAWECQRPPLGCLSKPFAAL
jgi:hypothetical protein